MRGDTCYNNPMFKSDGHILSSRDHDCKHIVRNNTKHKLIVGLQVAYQLRCTAIHAWNKDKPVKCQTSAANKRELYVSGRGLSIQTARGIAMAARV
ncbi:hypothetical protein DPMN_048885 [Dreissena polymorpha]|uniref:Uncharacterized protein n=1 Tax=Dreissena polymorpha TaxID=45954 RepID=A0A9D4I0L6_DREPO|nr:hypothetical protein DPMN_048885 [Dreissena polymorpha]